MRRGIRTSEFWVLVLTNVGLLAASFEGVLPPKWAVVAASVSSVAYSISRGLTKSRRV